MFHLINKIPLYPREITHFLVDLRMIYNLRPRERNALRLPLQIYGVESLPGVETSCHYNSEYTCYFTSKERNRGKVT